MGEDIVRNMDMDDSQFLSYMETHCRTQRKLFNQAQIARLATLAKAPLLWQAGAEWASFDPDFIDPLVADARQFLRQKEINMSVKEPSPIPNQRTPIQRLVINDMERRMEVGLERYGTYLQAHNGRDALVDWYQELLDATNYCRQEIEERRDLWQVIAETIREAGFTMPETRYLEQMTFLRDVVRAMHDAKQVKYERDTLYRTQCGEVWFWTTGDPEDGDNAETLTCPVILQPEDLAKILRQAAGDLNLAKEIDAARDQLVEELRVTEELLKGRDIILRAIPECKDHGVCIPHALEWVEQMRAPIPMVLSCPSCGKQHIDNPETDEQYAKRVVEMERPVERWTNPPHKTHQCEFCGLRWRPAPIFTVGVAKVIPGTSDTWDGNFFPINPERVWMFEIGVEGDAFHLHRRDSHCETAGCIEAKNSMKAGVRLALYTKMNSFPNKATANEWPQNEVVRIWSGERGAWWRRGGHGYTDDIEQAGVFTFSEAYRQTESCGQEKQIEYVTVGL